MLRFGFLAVTFATSLILQAGQGTAWARGGDEDEGEIGTASTSSTSSTASVASKTGASHHGKVRAKKKSKNVSGRVVAESELRKEPLPRPSGNLKIASVNFADEPVDVNIYNEDGSYNIEALHKVDHMLRCKRTNDEKPIEPRLVAILSHIYDHFGKPLEIVSGYRNQQKETSFHFKGSASDIRISGVAPKKIVTFANSLDTGGMGIGIYPKSQFVHVDVRPLPSFRWIDNSRANPNAREKQPPRTWRGKKLSS